MAKCIHAACWTWWILVVAETAKTRGCVSRASILSIVFKLAKSADGRWRALRGSELIAKVMTGVQFKNGIELNETDRQKIAA